MQQKVRCLITKKKLHTILLVFRVGLSNNFIDRQQLNYFEKNHPLILDRLIKIHINILKIIKQLLQIYKNKLPLEYYLLLC